MSTHKTLHWISEKYILLFVVYLDTRVHFYLKLCARVAFFKFPTEESTYFAEFFKIEKKLKCLELKVIVHANCKEK